MYQLLVYYNGDRAVRERREVQHASDVLTLIPELLKLMKAVNISW
jgi:hypothetical protein